MAWILQSDRPIYTQIVEKLQMQIVSGQYCPGDKLPSVRELAAQASVNPNTMQKAFAEIERSGLIITQRTSGRTVTEDLDMIKEVQQKLATNQINIFLQQMEELGYNKTEILELVNRILEKSRTSNPSPFT